MKALELVGKVLGFFNEAAVDAAPNVILVVPEQLDEAAWLEKYGSKRIEVAVTERKRGSLLPPK